MDLQHKFNDSWLVKQEGVQAEALQLKLDRSFLTDLKKLQEDKIYSDINVRIDLLQLHHKCIVITLAPTLYEILFLSSKEPVSYLAKFPDEVPVIEQFSLANLYGDQLVVKNHEVDLSYLLHTPVYYDVVFNVGQGQIKCHKCILSARCEYFSLMFSGHWREADQTNITIKNVSESIFKTVVEFVYKPSVILSEEASLTELLSVSDMYMLSELRNIVKFHMVFRYCHNFHKPCSNCIAGVIDTLNLSLMFDLNDLVKTCFNWFTKHYVEIFTTRDFATKCNQKTKEAIALNLKESVSNSNVLQHLKYCNKVRKSLPSVSWATKTLAIIVELESFCSQLLCNDFESVVRHPSFALVCLYNSKNVMWTLLAQELVTTAVKKSINRDNCLSVHSGILKINLYLKYLDRCDTDILEEAVDNCKRFSVQLDDVCKTCISKHLYYLQRTSNWNRLSDRSKIELKNKSGFI